MWKDFIRESGARTTKEYIHNTVISGSVALAVVCIVYILTIFGLAWFGV